MVPGSWYNSKLLYPAKGRTNSSKTPQRWLRENNRERLIRVLVRQSLSHLTIHNIIIKCDYAHNCYILYCSARRDSINIIPSESTPIQYKQASASGLYLKGKLLTPPPQPPNQKLSAYTAQAPLIWELETPWWCRLWAFQPAARWFLRIQARKLGTFNKHWKHWEPLLRGFVSCPFSKPHSIPRGLVTQPGIPENSRSQQRVWTWLSSPHPPAQLWETRSGSAMLLTTCLHFSPFKMWCSLYYWNQNNERRNLSSTGRKKGQEKQETARDPTQRERWASRSAPPAFCALWVGNGYCPLHPVRGHPHCIYSDSGCPG